MDNNSSKPATKQHPSPQYSGATQIAVIPYSNLPVVVEELSAAPDVSLGNLSTKNMRIFLISASLEYRNV